MILPFHHSHLENLDPVEVPFPPDRAEIAEAYARIGPAFTLEHRGRVLACGGVVLTGPNQGRGWAAVSRATARFPVTLTRVVRESLGLMEEAGLDRVTILVKKHHRPASRWVGLLGFRPVPVEDETSGSANHIVLERRKPCPWTSD